MLVGDDFERETTEVANPPPPPRNNPRTKPPPPPYLGGGRRGSQGRGKEWGPRHQLRLWDGSLALGLGRAAP